MADDDTPIPDTLIPYRLHRYTVELPLGDGRRLELPCLDLDDAATTGRVILLRADVETVRIVGLGGSVFALRPDTEHGHVLELVEGAVVADG